MSQVFAVALGALMLVFALRWFRREADRVEAAIRRTDRRIRRAARPVVTTPLMFDAAAGVYRPAD
ncbi:hypothetical protein [Rhodomicrobium udaipurense]|jgi:hypothetical protein|uniref:Uncharacterized protein n=1 Tax=Rhodomicrobium udaipurense TaxID=1202716 RepID=A0A8I1KGU8_9HYPH|nr:hypothetical protein [Rhodomicrobium udaipurense]MBJ7543100.1 hypothetical protein [Rhodomicrobium udaipurense]